MKWQAFPYGVFCVIIFFIVGYMGYWQYAWLIFLTTPLFYWFINQRGSRHDSDSKQSQNKKQN
ncbi:hypothetical protein ACRYI5_08765 [Furfurilactobacillus sp. WILCCON 0119]